MIYNFDSNICYISFHKKSVICYLQCYIQSNEFEGKKLVVEHGEACTLQEKQEISFPPKNKKYIYESLLWPDFILNRLMHNVIHINQNALFRQTIRNLENLYRLITKKKTNQIKIISRYFSKSSKGSIQTPCAYKFSTQNEINQHVSRIREFFPLVCFPFPPSSFFFPPLNIPPFDSPTFSPSPPSSTLCPRAFGGELHPVAGKNDKNWRKWRRRQLTKRRGSHSHG